MELNEAIYEIRSKEKMIKAVFQIGTGNTKEYLEDCIASALQTSKTELNKQVREGYFTPKRAREIHFALTTMPELEFLPTGEAVATFPEYKSNELFINSVAIKLSN